MHKTGLVYQGVSLKWKTILTINFVFGLELWISLFTGYSLREYGWFNSWTNILFVGIVGLLSWLYFRKTPFAQKQFGLSMCKFSTFAGLPLIPFWLLTFLGGNFYPIQYNELRSNQKVIENKFVCTDNAYCAVDVRLRYDFLPFFDRNLYGKRSNVPANVSWVSENIISIDLSGQRIEIELDRIKLEWPDTNLFFVGLYFIYSLFRQMIIKTKQASTK